MTRSIAFSLAVLASLFLSVTAQAAGVPHYVNFQSVLRDDGGNIIADDFIDLQIKILDQDKDVVYEETQTGVQVVRGAINVMIGEGVEPGSSPSTPTGGIPTDVLDPEMGSHFLQVQFGSNLPSDGMELGSVPYAMYSEKALKIDFNISPIDIPPVFLTTSTDFSGDISGKYNALQLGADVVGSTEIADGSVGPSELASTTVNPGSYTHASITVDQDGRVTASSSGSIITDHGGLTGLGDDDHPQYLRADGTRSMSGNLDMGGHNVSNIGSVDGVDLDNPLSALNANGAIKGGSYSAIQFRFISNVPHGANLCSSSYIPSTFNTSECDCSNSSSSGIHFLPTLQQYEGDGGGTERVWVYVDGATCTLTVKADSRADGTGSDGKLSNLATVLAIGTR